MKKNLFFTLLISAGFAFSCSSDDDNKDNNASLIVGKWIASQDGTIINNQEVLVDYVHDAPECGLDFVELKANNTGKDTTYYINSEEECDSFSNTFNYTIHGNTITYNYTGDESKTEEILSLTNSTLKTKYEVITQGDAYVYISVYRKE